MNKFLKTLLPIDIYKGLKVTGTHFLKVFATANRRKVKMHVTNEYPEVPVKLAPRFRGRLTMLKDEQGEIKCVCCLACEKICPTQVITIESGKKEGRKPSSPPATTSRWSAASSASSAWRAAASIRSS